MKPATITSLTIAAVILACTIMPELLITLFMPATVAHYYGWPLVVTTGIVMVLVPAGIVSLSILALERKQV